MSKGKRKSIKRRRTHRLSDGLRSHSKHPLSAIQKVLVGKGQAQSMRPLDVKFAWKGTSAPSHPVWDSEQVVENKRLYPHLFEGN